MSNEYQDWKRDEIFELKQELTRTREALDVAIDALKRISNHATAIDTARCRAEIALEQITTLEQKETK